MEWRRFVTYLSNDPRNNKPVLCLASGSLTYDSLY